MRVGVAFLAALCLLSLAHADEPASTTVTVDNSKLDQILSSQTNAANLVKSVDDKLASFSVDAVSSSLQASLSPALSKAVSASAESLSSSLSAAVSQAIAAAPVKTDDSTKAALADLSTKSSDQSSKLASVLSQVSQGSASSDDTNKRLDRLEKELSDLKSLLNQLSVQLQQQASAAPAAASSSSSAPISGDNAATLATMIDNQKQIMAKLDEGCMKHVEQWFQVVKSYAIYFGNELCKLLDRGYQRAREYYPIVADKAKEQWAYLQANGAVAAKQYGQQAYTLADQKYHETHSQLTSLLVANKVPAQYASILAISIIALAVLLAVFIGIKLFCAVFGCLCCRRSKKKPTPKKK